MNRSEIKQKIAELEKEILSLKMLLIHSNTEISLILISVLNQMFKTDIAKNSRNETVIKGRQFFYFYMKNNTKLSLQAISKKLIAQDHSTVINAIKRFEEYSDYDKVYVSEYKQFEENVQSILNRNLTP